MGIRRILARVDGTDGDRDVLGAALEAATSSDVDVVHVRFDSRDLPLITGYGIVDDLVGSADSRQRTADHGSKRARGHFEEWLQPEKVALWGSRRRKAWVPRRHGSSCRRANKGGG